MLDTLLSMATRWQPIVNLVVALATVATLAVVIWYTIETKRLRETAQDQIEVALDQSRASIRPTLFLAFERELTQNEHPPAIHNLGTGPAFNVVFDPVWITDTEEIRFNDVSIVGTSFQNGIPLNPAAFRGGNFYEWLKTASKFAFYLSRKAEREDSNVVLKATYSDAAGNKYASRFIVDFDVLLQKITTRAIVEAGSNQSKTGSKRSNSAN
jgi:hypothetical protein